jgi:hypothetical protein
MGDGEGALSDALRCRVLRPHWAKAFYREGAALMLLEVSLAWHCQCRPNLFHIDLTVWPLSLFFSTPRSMNMPMMLCWMHKTWILRVLRLNVTYGNYSLMLVSFECPPNAAMIVGWQSTLWCPSFLSATYIPNDINPRMSTRYWVAYRRISVKLTFLFHFLTGRLGNSWRIFLENVSRCEQWGVRIGRRPQHVPVFTKLELAGTSVLLEKKLLNVSWIMLFGLLSWFCMRFSCLTHGY